MYPLLAPIVFSGSFLGTVEGTNKNSPGTETSSRTGTTGTLSRPNNEVCYTFINFEEANSAVSINSSFTLRDYLNVSAGNNAGGAGAYYFPTASTALNPMWSWTTFAEASTVIACFY
jgi:hypothetical protein